MSKKTSRNILGHGLSSLEQKAMALALLSEDYGLALYCGGNQASLNGTAGGLVRRGLLYRLTSELREGLTFDECGYCPTTVGHRVAGELCDTVPDGGELRTWEPEPEDET